MLDRLLGRAELKERIAELEDERDSLQSRLDAESERRREAVAARQEAQEEVNRLEDRIAELEDRVERATSDERDLSFRGAETVRGERLGEILARLRSVETEAEGALTAMVENGENLPEAVRDALGERASLVSRAAPCLVCHDDAGLVSVALALPAAPEAFVEWGDGFRLEESWARPTGEFGFGLVRSDLFAFGVYDGRERGRFEGFETDVMGEHSKGGFSQRRFERRRDEQVAEHVEKVREALEEADVDRLVLVGDRGIVSELSEYADVTGAVDAGGDPEEALGEAFYDFWAVRLYLL